MNLKDQYLSGKFRTKSETNMNTNKTDKTNHSIYYLGHLVSVEQEQSLKEIETILSITDHTNLSSKSSESEIVDLCKEAVKAKEIFDVGPATVCVHPSDITICLRELKDTGIGICATVGFPQGKCSTAAKVADTIAAIEAGANEIDMVINISALKDRKLDLFKNDIASVVQAAKKQDSNSVVKVIIECCYLTNEEKIIACQISEACGADYVKTSTGFGTPGANIAAGATVEDIKLMSQTVSKSVKIKASGGIRSITDAIEMKIAGASRIGASKVVTNALEEASKILGISVLQSNNSSY